MKWIRTAITVVIMVVSVGVIALGINNLTQEKVKEEVVTFEILEYDSGDYIGAVTMGTQNKIASYINTDNENNVINIINAKYNDDILSDFSILYDNIVLIIYLDEINLMEFNTQDDSFYSDEKTDYEVGDTISITFEVPQAPILTGTIAIILGLVPLIVASGVLYFMLRKNNLGD